MRVEVRLAVVVSLRPKGAAFGQAGSTRLDSTRLCNTLEALIPAYVVDGPHVEHLKDARRANVEPTDAQAKWQHA